METLLNCPVCQAGSFLPVLSCKDHFLSSEVFEIVQCSNCGLRFTNPRPVPADLGKYYQSPDYISHSNSKKGLFHSIYQLIRKYTLSRKYRLIGQHAKGKHILDIGCATGEFLNFMKSKGWVTRGIEPDEAARKQAILRYDLSVGDENHLKELGNDLFDVITLWHVLEHVSDLQQRMTDLYRLLKPGGLLVIAVPNPESGDAVKYGSFWAGYDVPRHLYHFTQGSMTFLLDRFSFTLEKILPMKWDSFYVSLLSEKYRHGKMKWFPGIWNGYCSNRAALKNSEYSSLIYLSRKS